MTTVRLGDLAEIQLGKMLSPSARRGERPVRYLRNANVQWNHFELADVAEMDFSEVEEHKFDLTEGDVLVCEGGEPGRAAVWHGEIERCCYQKALHRIRPKFGVLDAQFLVYRLWHGALQGEFDGDQTATTIAHLPAIRLAELRIHLPPIAKQRRLAARLTDQLAAVAATQEAASAQSQRSAQLRVTVVRDLIPLPAAATFPIVPLSECVEFLDHRRRPINQSERDQRVLGKSPVELYPYYGANGQAGWIDDYLFDEPLVLLAEDGGSFGSPTRPIAYRIDGRTWVNNHAHVLRPLAHMDVDYLLHALAIRPDIADVISGSTRGKLNREVAGEISVSVPPLPEQRRIAAKLRERLAEIDAITAAIDAELEAIEALPAALLRRAFDGLAA